MELFSYTNPINGCSGHKTYNRLLSVKKKQQQQQQFFLNVKQLCVKSVSPTILIQ